VQYRQESIRTTNPYSTHLKSEHSPQSFRINPCLFSFQFSVGAIYPHYIRV